MEEIVNALKATLNEETRIYDNETRKLIQEVKLIHGVLARKESIEELEKKIEEQNEKKNASDEEQKKSSKSRAEVASIIGGLECCGINLAEKANVNEEIFKTPSLRFKEIAKKEYKNYKEDLEALEKKIKDDCDLTVRLVEDIDIKNASSDKFYIYIEDENNNYVMFDLLKYQEKIYDYTFNEEDLIIDKLVQIKGVYSEKVIAASKDIANYISIALAFKESFYYQYKLIGWDAIDGNTVFKYDKIYTNHKEGYKGFCGGDWADAIVCKQNEDQKHAFHCVFKLIFDTRYDEDGNSVLKNEKGEDVPNTEKADIILCAGVSGVIRQALTYNKETNININIVGDKSSGKSTIQHLVLSFFGDPSELEGFFSDTDEARSRIRAERAVIPYVLDERMLKVEGDSDKKKAHVMMLEIFNEYEGKVKETAHRNYLTGKRTYSAIISSSVKSVLELINREYNTSGGKDNEKDTGQDNGQDIGQYKRFIEIDVSKGDLFPALTVISDESSISMQDSAKALYGKGSVAQDANKFAYQVYGYGIQDLIPYMLKMITYKDCYECLVEAGSAFAFDDIMRSVDALINDSHADIEEFGYESLFIEYKDNSEQFNALKKMIECFKARKADIAEDEHKKKADKHKDDKKRKNDLSLFDTLFARLKQEIELKVKSYRNGVYFSEMGSSVERFTLLALTGYILNYSIGDDTAGFLHMDIDLMVDALIQNLYDKLLSGKVIYKWNENLTEDNAVVDEGKNKLSDSEKEKYCKKYLYQLYQWIKENKEFFYIPDKKKLQEKDKFIGRYKEIGGNIQVTIPTNDRKIRWDTILSYLGASGQEFLEYEYGSKTLEKKSTCPITFEDILKYCQEFVYRRVMKNPKTKPQFWVQGKDYRGDEYIFDCNSLENMDLQEEE